MAQSDNGTRFRQFAISELSSEEYEMVKSIIDDPEYTKDLCDKLATVTFHTSFEWRNTLVCAVTDYVGKDGWV